MIPQKFSKFRIIMNCRSNSTAHLHVYIYIFDKRTKDKIGECIVKGKFEKTSVLSRLSRDEKNS